MNQLARQKLCKFNLGSNKIGMQMEDMGMSEESMQEILSDPCKRAKLIRIMLQSMHQLGYHDSFASLQLESQVTYHSPQVHAIQQLLHSQDYLPLLALTAALPLHPHTHAQLADTLHDLLFDKYMAQDDLQAALQLVQSPSLSRSKSQQYSEMLVLAPPPMQPNLRLTLHEQIVSKCANDSLEPHLMDRIIKEYLQLQEQPAAPLDPPMKILCTAGHEFDSVAAVKFSHRGDKLLVACETPLLSLWKVADSELVRIAVYIECAEQTASNVQTLSWSHDSDSHIAVCCDHTVRIFSGCLSLTASIEPTETDRLLCAEWHPISHLLYVGGLFNEVRVYTCDGELCMKVQPFMKTRQVLFGCEFMYCLSATDSKLAKYSLIEEVHTQEFSDRLPFMQMALDSNHERLLVSHQDNIFLLSAGTLKVLLKLSSPDNPDHLTLQVGFYHPWIIAMCDGFIAYSQHHSELQNHLWHTTGLFDISGEFMVSAYKGLTLWTRGQIVDSPQPSEHSIEDSESGGVSELSVDEDSLMGLHNLDSDNFEDTP